MGPRIFFTVLRRISWAVQGVFRLADRGAPGDAGVPIEHSPLELLMQLYEDTGFSRRMYQVMPEELTHGSTRAVGLACDLISCIAAAEYESPSQLQDAYKALKKTADSLRKIRTSCVSFLSRWPQKVRTKSVFCLSTTSTWLGRPRLMS